MFNTWHMWYGHGIVQLDYVINAIEINHLNMTNCDCSAIVNDVTIIIIKYLLFLLFIY